MKKIKYISDGTATIPVGWKLNASIADEDIPLHNAMIMGAVMARRIDTMHLWDGTIIITQQLSAIDLLQEQLEVSRFNTNVNANTQIPTSGNYTIPFSGIDLNGTEIDVNVTGSVAGVDLVSIPRLTLNETPTITLNPPTLDLFGMNESVTIERN